MQHPKKTGSAMIRAALCDLNGIWRGKLMPAEQLEKVLGGAMRMPLSTAAIDVFGADVAGSPLVFDSGDADGCCLPIPRGALHEPWQGGHARFVPVMMQEANGTPSPIDPRQILAAVAKKLAGKGYRPVMAVEMEFYLMAEAAPAPVPPQPHAEMLSLDNMAAYDGFFEGVYEACATYGIPADAAISEGGAGQFEINILHGPDPVVAADNAVFFKRIVKGVARKHGLVASFMPKPYLDAAGSGMHVHFSLLDEAGRNMFDDGSPMGSDMLQHAVAGLLRLMPASTLVFAPHLNSYRRLAPDSHAPTGIGWGYENRTSAIRIPGGSPKARRIEHRVAGADANPYLLLAVLLAGVLEGLEQRETPPAPTKGNAYEAGLAQLPGDWAAAIAAFETDTALERHLNPQFHDIFAAMKRQEFNRFAARMSDFELSTYLSVV
ncbi:MAG: glutamine synthetase family protein [Rhodobacteraceae bacterium]|nr:glutamine synthetase family protein [Paracoccaceae bacterium]